MEQHDEQEHEVYGGEIPDEEAEMDTDLDIFGGAEDCEGNEHELEQDPSSNSKVPVPPSSFFKFFSLSFS